jgi:hypothetical protein
MPPEAGTDVIAALGFLNEQSSFLAFGDTPYSCAVDGLCRVPEVFSESV